MLNNSPTDSWQGAPGQGEVSREFLVLRLALLTRSATLSVPVFEAIIMLHRAFPIAQRSVHYWIDQVQLHAQCLFEFTSTRWRKFEQLGHVTMPTPHAPFLCTQNDNANDNNRANTNNNLPKKIHVHTRNVCAQPVSVSPNQL